MKRITLIRLLGIITVLSLLLMVVPVLPAYAAYTITLSASTGKIGDSVTVYGSFNDSPSERFAKVYFSSSDLAIGTTSFITAAPSYKYVGGEDVPVDDETSLNDNFTVSFTVPSSLPAMVDPTQGGTVSHNVTSGTYYVLVTYLGSTGTEIGVQAKATFTVTVPTLYTPDPTSGPTGTLVVITGSNFPASTAITLKFDTTTITPVSGTTTYANGMLLTSFNIPSDATAGAHTIYVTVSDYTASKTFTVSAAAALGTLSPTSGPPSTFVAISGTNFPASTTIVFKFDTAVLTPTGSSQTGPAGSFASVLTIPASATVGAHTITVTVGSIERTATFTVTGTAATATLNALTPDSGPPGTNVAISGSNFAASSAIIVTFDTTTITLSGSTQTSADGSFSGVIVIPTGATAGAHTITVAAGATSATANFTVTQSPTTPPAGTFPLDIELSGDFVGSSVSIASSGFSPNSVITISIDGENITQRSATESGLFFVTLTLPSLQHGEHTITATDGTNTATADFTVESTPPDTPLPISPAMGEAISSPASFDWSDVDDASKPVTYNLQIATTNTFNPDSILINTTNITGSQYTLTEDEQLRISSEITYYWRERAVDAAFNASGWTGAGEFTMVKPFEFTGWPLYLTISLGGLVLFLLGLWVGRRTAFFY